MDISTLLACTCLVGAIIGLVIYRYNKKITSILAKVNLWYIVLRVVVRGWIIKITGSGDLQTRDLAGVYTLTYYDGSQKYVAVFPRIRGPSKISIVMSNGVTVTDEIRKFGGPSFNFHGIPTTPRMLGYDNLTFYYRFGNSSTFGSDELIIV
jgi:hypothetical protein